MRKRLRVVIDTNVLISGLLGNKQSPSSYILQAVRRQKLILVISPATLEEIRAVINRPRIVKHTRMSQCERKNFIDELIERSEVTPGKQLALLVTRDMKDDKFLACAVEGNVPYLITGDEDLLVMNHYNGTIIITPRDFLKKI